jgi:hypothetical protein
MQTVRGEQLSLRSFRASTSFGAAVRANLQATFDLQGPANGG